MTLILNITNKQFLYAWPDIRTCALNLRHEILPDIGLSEYHFQLNYTRFLLLLLSMQINMRFMANFLYFDELVITVGESFGRWAFYKCYVAGKTALCELVNRLTVFHWGCWDLLSLVIILELVLWLMNVSAGSTVWGHGFCWHFRVVFVLVVVLLVWEP